MGRAFEYRKASKERRWGNMSRIFPKLGKHITIAAKNGIANPDMNPRLRSAILNAKAENMPKELINKAIKRATDKNLAELKELHYEAKSSYGTLFIIECGTDNHVRTTSNLKTILNKNSAELLPENALDFLFSRKSIFQVNMDENIDLEELELDLINYGLEEFNIVTIVDKNNENIDIIEIQGEFKSFGELSKVLDEKKVNIREGSLKYIPTSPIKLKDIELENISILLNKLEENDDVQTIYSNIIE